MKTKWTRHITHHGIVVLLLLAVIATGSASADIVKNFEFNSDGVLPSADPEIIYLAPSGNIEADIYSVSGGVLTGDHWPGGSQPIKYSEMYGVWPTNGGISPTEPWMVEIRARVVNQEGGAYLGAFTMWNSAFRFSIFFTETGVTVIRAATHIPTNYTCDNSQWRVLRMWGAGQYFSASVDGVLFADNISGVNDANVLNGFFLQVNPHGEGAHMEWDYMRFESGENAITNEDVSFGKVKTLFR